MIFKYIQSIISKTMQRNNEKKLSYIILYLNEAELGRWEN